MLHAQQLAHAGLGAGRWGSCGPGRCPTWRRPRRTPGAAPSGGVGFTWAHDAHLYLRRALALRQLFGGTSRWRQRTADAALAARRPLTLPLPAEAESLRDVRAVVDPIAVLPITWMESWATSARAAVWASATSAPAWGLVVADVDDGTRAYGRVEDPDLLVALEAKEWVGRTIRLEEAPEGVNLVRAG